MRRDPQGGSRGLASPAMADRPPATRVTHFFGVLDRGGTETVSLDLCRAIPADEVEQTFVSLADREGSLAGQFRAAGAKVVRCRHRPLWLMPIRVWRLLRRDRPDVVVSHIALWSGVVLLVARVVGVPIRIARIASEGDGKGDALPHRLIRRVLRWMLRHSATEVAAVTGSALRFARPPADDTRYRVLFNSVDEHRVTGWDRAECRRQWDLPPEIPVFVHIGRAIPDKNRPFLIEVLRALRRLCPEAVLVAAGPGGNGDLEARYPRINDEPGLVLAGEVEHIGPVLAVADVLLLPSKREGLPGVILEALSIGVPAIATDLPGLRETSQLIPGLELRSLDEPALTWAESALRLARAGADLRDQIRAVFRTSPFTQERAVAEWMSRWRR